jgi:hypothetical protein
MRANVRTPLSSHATGGPRRATLRRKANPEAADRKESQPAGILGRYASKSRATTPHPTISRKHRHPERREHRHPDGGQRRLSPDPRVGLTGSSTVLQDATARLASFGTMTCMTPHATIGDAVAAYQTLTSEPDGRACPDTPLRAFTGQAGGRTPRWGHGTGSATQTTPVLPSWSAITVSDGALLSSTTVPPAAITSGGDPLFGHLGAT